MKEGSPETRNRSPCLAQRDPDSPLDRATGPPPLLAGGGWGLTSRAGLWGRGRAQSARLARRPPGTGKGLEQNVSYSSFFLPGPAPPLPPNNSFPIAQHASQQQGSALKGRRPQCDHPGPSPPPRGGLRTRALGSRAFWAEPQGLSWLRKRHSGPGEGMSVAHPEAETWIREGFRERLAR